MRSVLVLGLIGLASAGAVGASAAHSTARKPCPQGSVAARFIGGERACLATGQKCRRALDAQYRRYGFHCHAGARLTAYFSRKVDVGGFRLTISCRGTGSPTVVLESGAGWGSSAWFLLEPGVANTTRVCSYDRAGLEESDGRRPAEPVPAARVVEELHSLLAGAGISPPYVLGGWSLGGFFIRLYTKRYPAEVVGLVSVDATPWGLPGEPFLDFPPPVIGHFGGPDASESFYLADAVAELAASPDLGARPLVVLKAGFWPQEWVKWDRQMAALSTSSILVRADGAGHWIQHDAPRLTAAAFRQVIAAVRAGTPLPACSATPLPALDGSCLDPTSAEIGAERTR